MWLEAKHQWCNKILGSIWWSEDGAGLGKECYDFCSGYPTCHHLWLPYLCFFPSHKCSDWVFFLAVKHSQSWGIGNTPGCSSLVKVVSPALVTSSHPVLLPMDEHKMTLTQQDFIPVSQDGLLILKEIKSDFRAVVPSAAMMFPSCILPTNFLLFCGENWPCSALVRSLTLCATLCLSCNDKGASTPFNRLLEISASSVKYTGGRTHRSPDSFHTKPHISEENTFILF